MGCINSKTKKKSKERDTLSQEAARETAKERQAAAEDALSRQNTSAEQAAGMQPRDDVDQAPSPTVKNPDELDVPVPDQAAASSPPPPAPSSESPERAKEAETVVSTAAEAVKATADYPSSTSKEKKSHHRHHRKNSSASSASSDQASAATAQTSSSQAAEKKNKTKNRKEKRQQQKKKKIGRRSRDGISGESVSVSDAASHSLSRSDNIKKQEEPISASRCSPSASSQALSVPLEGTSVSDEQRLDSAQGRLKTRRTSTSGSSLSFELQSEAAPPAMQTALYPDSGDAQLQASSFLAGAARSSSDGGRAGKTNVSVDDAAAVPVLPQRDAEAAVVVVSRDTSRLPYEPYNDFGPEDGEDGVPPYEWVPRTMPVPSPLRQQEIYRVEEKADDYSGLAYGGTSAAAAAAQVDDEVTVSRSVRFHDPAVSDVDVPMPSLTPRTFYPRLPAAQWPSYTPPPFSMPNNMDSPNRSDVVSVEETSEIGEDEEEEYGGWPALYSPEENRAEQRGTNSPVYYQNNGGDRYVRNQQPVVAPSLVDAYVSEEPSALYGSAAPPYRYTADYESYTAPPPPPQPKISILPSAYSYGPSPMLSSSTAAAAMAPAPELDGYATSQYGRAYASASMHGGVSAHQYKPVTYLFDNSMDNWLQTRRMAAPQRELYSDAAELW